MLMIVPWLLGFSYYCMMQGDIWVYRKWTSICVSDICMLMLIDQYALGDKTVALFKSGLHL